MKNYCLLAILILVSIELSAQNWAPFGAKWTYTQSYYGTNKIDTFTIKCVGDTIIQNQLCKKLKKNSWICDKRPDVEFMYSDSGRVYYFDMRRDSFQMLYNFNAQPGFSYTIYPNPKNGFDYIDVLVDSVKTIIINGLHLKKVFQHATKSEGEYFFEGGEIIENIGDTYYMFPWSSGACDVSWAHPIRCYKDTILGFHDFKTAISCDYTLSIEQQYSWPDKVGIYPNPTQNIISIKCTSSFELRIYSSDGRLISKEKIKQNQTDYDLSNLQAGLYIVTITGEDWIQKSVIVKK